MSDHIKTDWHRIFGVSLAGTLIGAPFHVEIEFELAKRKQRLDVAIIRTDGTDPHLIADFEYPDGLTNLAHHNVVTFKSIRESLRRGSMWELAGYSVIYAKQQWRGNWSRRMESIADLQAIAVTVQLPQWLASEPRTELAAGVWEVRLLGLPVRVVVPRMVYKTPKIAIWLMLSGDPELIEFGMNHFQVKDAGLYNVLNDLRSNYQLEGVEMPYTLEDYKREKRQEMLDEAPSFLTEEERATIVSRFTAEERLKGLPAEERIKGLSEQELIALEMQLQRLRASKGKSEDETKK